MEATARHDLKTILKQNIILEHFILRRFNLSVVLTTYKFLQSYPNKETVDGSVQ